jgi:hypothetical protein
MISAHSERVGIGLGVGIVVGLEGPNGSAFIQDRDLQEGYVRSIQKYSDDQKQLAI